MIREGYPAPAFTPAANTPPEAPAGSALATSETVDAEFKVIGEAIALHDAALSDDELKWLSDLVQSIREAGTVSPKDERRLAVAAPRLLAMLLGIKGRAEEVRDRAQGQIFGEFGGGAIASAAQVNHATMRSNLARHILGEKI